VERILSAKRAAPDADTTALEREMNERVYRLYDLTEAEFTHILGTFPLVDAATKQLTLNTYRDFLRLGKLPANRS